MYFDSVFIRPLCVANFMRHANGLCQTGCLKRHTDFEDEKLSLKVPIWQALKSDFKNHFGFKVLEWDHKFNARLLHCEIHRQKHRTQAKYETPGDGMLID